MSFESVLSRMKEDVCGSIVLAASAIGILLSFTYFSIIDGEITGGFDLPIEPDQVLQGIDMMFSGDLEHLVTGAIAMPLYLLTGSLKALFYVAPFVLLCVSLAVRSQRRRRALIIAALIADVVSYPASGILNAILSGHELFRYLSLDVFVFVALPAVVFLICLIALKNRVYAAPIACSALCLIGLVFLAFAIPPFGSSYTDETHYDVSVYLHYAALWFASAFAVLSVNNSKKSFLLRDSDSALDKHGRSSGKEPSLLESANQLKELKTLLDEGILAQEEYDLKKSEILGLESDENKTANAEIETVMTERNKKSEEEGPERQHQITEEKTRHLQSAKDKTKKYGRIGGIVLAAVCLICIIGIGCNVLSIKDSMKIEDVENVLSSSRETVLKTFPKAKTLTADDTVVVEGVCGGIDGEYRIHFNHNNNADRVVFRWDKNKITASEKNVVNDLSDYLGNYSRHDFKWDKYEWEDSLGMDVEFWPDSGIWFEPEDSY